MSEKLKIKISIANRVYPLTILPNQEQGLRIAAQKIEKTVKKFEQNYSVQDKQDVLAMCALQYAAKLEQNNNIITSSKDQNDEKVSELINIIDVHLNAY